MVRSKYETLIQLIGKEDGWAMFEDEKTFPDGVVIVARYGSFFFLRIIDVTCVSS